MNEDGQWDAEKMNSRRLMIFCFYNKAGIVEKYVLDLLQQMRPLLLRLIIVVNGEIDENGYQSMCEYTKEIIKRENKGLDYGAYRHILLEYLRDGELNDYDELIFCNDTFYGFFLPMEKIFDEMENRELDMWGINYVERGLLDHIQSYFLVFNKKIIENQDLISYMKTNDEKNNTYGQIAAFLAETALRVKKAVYTNEAFYHYRQRQASGCHTDDLTKLKEWIDTYQRIIKLFENENVGGKTIDYVKRFLAYHASNATEKQFNRKMVI